MTEIKFKDFLSDFLAGGAFLQTGPDRFKLLLGPFEKHNSPNLENAFSSTFLYKPGFWDFLDRNRLFSQESVYFGSREFELTRAEFQDLVSHQAVEEPAVVWEPPDEKSFRQQYDWSQQQFAVGALRKTVPMISQKGAVELKPAHVGWSLRHLLQNDSYGWSYGFFENGVGVLGHSPEILGTWSSHENKFRTMAVAGTYAKTESAFTEILKDPKILKEHGLVIEDIFNRLSRVGQGEVEQGKTEVLELRHLLHLITRFEMPLIKKSVACELLQVLHPTSAMGIFPRNQAAFQELSQLSLQTERNGFGSPFGFVEKNGLHCVVAIRNLRFLPSGMQIFSGCGVTAESVYDDEVAELANKRQSVKKMLGLA